MKQSVGKLGSDAGSRLSCATDALIHKLVKEVKMTRLTKKNSFVATKAVALAIAAMISMNLHEAAAQGGRPATPGGDRKHTGARCRDCYRDHYREREYAERECGQPGHGPRWR